MELRFAVADLRKLDQAVSEVLAVPLTEGERPPRGVAGLVDYRTGGAISELIERGFASGQLGETLLLPGRPKLTFDKVVCFGIGRPEHFNEQLYRSVVEHMLDTISGLGVRRAVVELPGRKSEAIAPERAAELLLDRALERGRHDAWTLIESPDAQRAITKLLQQDRRREWRF